MDLSRKIFNFFTSPCKRSLGLKLHRELEGCAAEIMCVFGVTEFMHDAENVWEWVEGTSKSGLKVNVSRSHSFPAGGAGDYEKPIVIKVSGAPSFVARDKMSEYAKKLVKVFQVEIWLGEMIIPKNEDRDYYFEIEEKFLP
jgi:hypothetical protein